MEAFNLFSKCPTCGYGTPGEGDKPAEINSIRACAAKASDVPLRCQHCVDLEEYNNFPRELYHAADGKIFRPITKIVEVEYEVEVLPTRPDPTNPDLSLEPLMEKRFRKEKVIDLDATVRAGVVQPPATIKHVHRTCGRCNTEWPELIQE